MDESLCSIRILIFFLQKRACEDIKRRLGILLCQKKENKLSETVRLKTSRLVAGIPSPMFVDKCLTTTPPLAIELSDYGTADSIHIELMVDHVSEVNQWLVGIKKLIATLKSSNSS